MLSQHIVIYKLNVVPIKTSESSVWSSVTYYRHSHGEVMCKGKGKTVKRTGRGWPGLLDRNKDHSPGPSTATSAALSLAAGQKWDAGTMATAVGGLSEEALR